MAKNYTDDERARILARSFELLSRNVTDVGRPENSESEMDRDEMLRQELARPTERHNRGREFDEWKARRAAEREADTMEKLEARIVAKIADQEDRIYKAVSKVFEKFYEPLEKQITELREEVETLRIRGPVSVTAAAVNHKGELMLTLSDGTILTPGRIGREAEVLDLPNPLPARRMR